MAAYEFVSKITGFTVYIGGTTSATTSGYTLATPLYGIIDLTPGTSPAEVLNNCKITWQFGDGYVEQTNNIVNNNIQSSNHSYSWPGEYEVKLSITSNDSISGATFSKRISANNYLTDRLVWNYSAWSDLSSANLAAGAVFHGFQSCKPGELNSYTPLTVSFTTCVTLSDRIGFNLYSQNSLSQPWETVTNENKYANLRPRWRFLDIEDNIIDEVKPSQDQLYPVYITSTGTETTAESGTLVGFTGAFDFYYIDDIPSLGYNGSTYTVNTPIIWVVTNTLNYPNYQDINDSSRPSYSNSTISVSSYFYVKHLSAAYCNISLNGGSIPLPNTIWPGITGNFITSINSTVSSDALEAEYANKTLLNYPVAGSLTGSITATPVYSTTFATSSFNISRYDSLNRDTGGYYKNTLYTLAPESLTAANVSCTLIVEVPAVSSIKEPPANALSGYNPNTRISAATTSNALYSISLTGSTSYNIKNFNKNYFVRKINEDFNYGAQLQSYALQPTIASNDNLFVFLSAVAGDSYTTEDNYGTKVYEKTSNFVLNTQDICTSNINNLYSLTDSIDTKFDNFNLDVPPILKRAFDLFSISHYRLWGTREKYNTNFDATENHTNLGAVLTAYNINTTTVTAGQKIVLNDIFTSSYYELIEVPKITSYASVTAANMQSFFPIGVYPLSSYPLTAYALSAFFGWGVKTPVKDYYKFYVHNNVYSDSPRSGVIDWNTKTDGLSTTLTESNSSVTEWYKDDGILENIYSYYLCKGLDLFK